MGKREYWNTTDHSVTVDSLGRQVDGGSYTILEVTEEVQRAVELGKLKDNGEFDPKTYNGPASFPQEEGAVGYVDMNPVEEVSDESPESDTTSESVQAEDESGKLTQDGGTTPVSTNKKKRK